MKICARTIVLAVTLFLGCARSDAAEKYLPDIQRIVDNGKLVIAVTSVDIPPMVMTDNNGNLSGFDIELARDIAAALGVRSEFVVAGTSKELIAAVAGGKADIALSNLSVNVEDAKIVYFTTPYLVQSLTLLVNRKRGIQFNRYCPSLANADELTRSPNEIGVRSESQYERILMANDPYAVPRRFDAVSDLLEAALRGDILASMQGEVVAKGFLQQNPQASILLKLCPIGEEKDHIAIAVRPDAPGLLKWIDVYLELRGVVIDADQVIYRAGPIP